MRLAPAVDTQRKIEIALEYLGRGWALLPIAPHGKCPYSQLLPLDPLTNQASWKMLSLRSATEAEVKSWFEHDPSVNIGVICGPASGGLVVADFDKAIPADWHKPLTPRVITGRGEHFYFKKDCAQSTRILSYKGDKIGELRGDGAYVVLPPSLHPSGSTYHWAEAMSPDDLELAPVPSWGADLNEQNSTARKKTTEGKRVENILYSLTLGNKGMDLGAWDSYEPFVTVAASLMGIDPTRAHGNGLGKTFKCVLPGHIEKHPSASLHRRDDGLIVYHDWHAASGQYWYDLAEVRASQAYGEARKLRGPELATWHLRLIVEAGFLIPAIVEMPELPSRCAPSVKKAYDGFKFLLGCKWLHSPGEPTPFSWRFASAWCGISERHTGDAIQELMRCRVIRVVEKVRKHGRDLYLFMPG